MQQLSIPGAPRPMVTELAFALRDAALQVLDKRDMPMPPAEAFVAVIAAAARSVGEMSHEQWQKNTEA